MKAFWELPDDLLEIIDFDPFKMFHFHCVYKGFWADCTTVNWPELQAGDVGLGARDERRDRRWPVCLQLLRKTWSSGGSRRGRVFLWECRSPWQLLVAKHLSRSVFDCVFRYLSRLFLNPKVIHYFLAMPFPMNSQNSPSELVTIFRISQ